MALKSKPSAYTREERTITDLNLSRGKARVGGTEHVVSGSHQGRGRGKCRIIYRNNGKQLSEGIKISVYQVHLSSLAYFCDTTSGSRYKTQAHKERRHSVHSTSKSLHMAAAAASKSKAASIKLTKVPCFPTRLKRHKSHGNTREMLLQHKRVKSAQYTAIHVVTRLDKGEWTAGRRAH